VGSPCHPLGGDLTGGVRYGALMSSSVIPRPILLALFLFTSGCVGSTPSLPLDTTTDAKKDSSPADTQSSTDTHTDGDIIEDSGGEATSSDGDTANSDTLGPKDIQDTANKDTKVPDATNHDGIDAQDSGGDISDVQDTGPLDTSPPPPVCDPPCSVGELCSVGGLCLTDCGAGFDGNALLEELAPDLTVISNICASNVYGYYPLTANTILQLEVADGSPSSPMVLKKITYGGLSGPEFEIVSVAGVPGSIANQEVLAHNYLSVDPQHQAALYGFVKPYAQGAGGAVYRTDLNAPGASPLTLDAPGHFDAALIDKTSLLINGWGAAGVNAGAAVYRVFFIEGVPSSQPIITNIGIGGGMIEVHGDLVLAGGHADPWPTECGGIPVNTPKQGTKVFAFSLANLEEAAGLFEQVDAFCNSQKLDLPSDLHFLPSGDLLGQDPANGQFLSRYIWTQFNGIVLIKDVKPIALGPKILAGRGVPGTNLIVLQHQHGFLVVQ
jgi:hypothetical protein